MDTENATYTEPDLESVYAGGDHIEPEGATTNDFGDDFTPTGPETIEEPAVEAVAAEQDNGEEVPDEAAPVEEAVEGEPESAEAAPAPEPEAEAAPEPEPEPEPQNKPNRNQKVPYHRLEAKNRKIKALESRLNELEGQKDVSTPTQPTQQAATSQYQGLSEEQVLEKRQEQYNLILDGKMVEAARIDQEIQQDMTARATFDAQQVVASEVTRVSAEEQFDNAVNRLQDNYEFLDPSSELFDSALTTKIVALRDGYIQQGYQPADALEEAAADMLQLHKPELFQEEPEPQAVTPVAAPAPQPAAIKKAVEAAAAQPNRVSGTSTRSVDTAGPDIFSMSDDEFDQLSETELARLRGDLV